MLAEIEFNWGTKIPYGKAVSLAEVLDHKLEDIISNQPDDDGLVELISWRTYVVDIEELNGVIPNTPFTIKRLLKTKYDYLAILEKMKEAADKLEKITFEPQQDFNYKVNVHVPNLGLLMVNEVTWLEDCCAEVLQEYLDKGWRILAVCPQPDQRRPDYILGRTKN